MSKQLDSMLGKELTDYELLYIDDGSNDMTLELIETIAAQNTKVRYISLSRNFGVKEVF